MRLFLMIALLAVTPLMAEEQEPRAMLTGIANSCYNLEATGLNRASCYVKSDDICNALDATAKKIARSIDLEAVFIPGKKVELSANNIPSRLGGDARMGVQIFTAKVEKWLNQILDHLDTIPQQIDPNKSLKDYDYAWIEGDEGRKMVLLKKAEAQKEEKNGRGAEIVNRMKQMMQNQKANRRGGENKMEKVMGNEPDVPKVELAGNDLEIHLSRSGQLEEILIRKGLDLEKIRIKTKKAGDKWLIEDLDVALFDEQQRLKERNLIRYYYTNVKGVYLPSKVTLKALDAKGKLLDRRDDPNPLTIDFTKHIVEVR